MSKTGKIGNSKDEFVKDMAEYVMTSPNYEKWDVPAAIKTTLQVLSHDIGAAQAYLDAIGINLDIYTYDFFQANKERIGKTVEITAKEIVKLRLRSSRRGFIVGAVVGVVGYHIIRKEARKALETIQTAN